MTQHWRFTDPIKSLQTIGSKTDVGNEKSKHKHNGANVIPDDEAKLDDLELRGNSVCQVIMEVLKSLPEEKSGGELERRHLLKGYFIECKIENCSS